MRKTKRRLPKDGRIKAMQVRLGSLEDRVAAVESATRRPPLDPEVTFQQIVIDFDRRTVTRDGHAMEATAPVLVIPVLRPGHRNT